MRGGSERRLWANSSRWGRAAPRQERTSVSCGSLSTDHLVRKGVTGRDEATLGGIVSPVSPTPHGAFIASRNSSISPGTPLVAEREKIGMARATCCGAKCPPVARSSSSPVPAIAAVRTSNSCRPRGVRENGTWRDAGSLLTSPSLKLDRSKCRAPAGPLRWAVQPTVQLANAQSAVRKAPFP